MQLIDGKKIAKKIENNLKKSKHKGGLGVILVGSNPESHLYVRLKEKAAKRVGIKFEKYFYPTSPTLSLTKERRLEQEIIKKINQLNNDKSITGIIVQLPLLKGLDTNKIISAINPEKDADGYHPENLKNFQAGNFPFFPPVLGAVIEILKSIKADLRKKSVALISKSDIFPIPYQAYFKKYAKNFIRCRPRELNECLLADVVITALGRKHYLKSEYIKKGAIVIDVGVKRAPGKGPFGKGKKVYGDADPASLKKKAGWLTPVPGGVGPLTVACLLKNVLK